MRDIEDFLWRASLDEFGQHLAPEKTRVFDLTVKLAVRECSSTALAELHIRFRIKRVLAPKLPGVFRAFAHGLAAFEHDRVENPICASTNAAKIPAGPKPTTIGRNSKFSGAWATKR